MKALRISWQTFGLLAALAVIWAFFYFGTQGTFGTARNLALLARQMTVTAFLACGMVLVIVCGQIDLSVGALTGLCGGCVALLGQAHFPFGVALAGGLLAGALLGGLQGALVAYSGLPAFIVTLGGMLVFQGSLLGLTRGVSIMPPDSFLLIGQWYVPRLLSFALLGAWMLGCLAWGLARKSVLRWSLIGVAGLAAGSAAALYEGFPLPVLLLLGVACASWILASQSVFGRQLYAIGGNQEAAFYSGVPIQARLLGVFVLMGALCGLAGTVLMARVGAASSDAGRMLELDAIAAAVIGGTSLMGGKGSIWGALLGALVMASIDNGMSLMNTEAFWQPILKGGILIAAVGLDLASRKRTSA